MKWTWLNTTDEMNMIKYNRWNETWLNTTWNEHEHDQIQQMKWTWTWSNTIDEMNMNMIKYNRWNEHDQIQ